MRLSESDLGRYRCQATNSYGMSHHVEKSVTFTCTKAFNVQISGDRSDGLYNRNERLLLKCEARGQPAPKISWYKDGRLYDNDRANLE